jgi:hypothetical protein
MKKEIVYTDKYALILDMEKDIEENMFTLKDGKIIEVSYLGQDNGNAIIAHLPLSDAPILKGVPLLPPLPHVLTEEEELKIYDMGLDYASEYKGEGSHPNPEGYSQRQIGMFHGFSDGYIKAKEKYKYTEEDLKLAMNYGYVQGDTGFQGVANLDDLLDLIHRKIKKPSRPTHFECEIAIECTGNNNEGCFMISPAIDCGCIKVKTITNSQGHIELVGKYLNL